MLRWVASLRREPAFQRLLEAFTLQMRQESNAFAPVCRRTQAIRVDDFYAHAHHSNWQ